MTFAVVSAPKSLCRVEFFKPLITDRSAQSCPQSWCLFFFFLRRLTDLFLVLIYSTLVSQVFCFKQTDDQKTVTCTFKERVSKVVNWRRPWKHNFTLEEMPPAHRIRLLF